MVSSTTWYNPETTKFIIKNVNPSGRKIKIFNYPIGFGKERDLLQIPGISESDIRNSLLKSELYKKIKKNQILITNSNIDLTQFDDSQKALLESVGLVIGASNAENSASTEYVNNENLTIRANVIRVYATKADLRQDISGYSLNTRVKFDNDPDTFIWDGASSAADAGGEGFTVDAIQVGALTGRFVRSRPYVSQRARLPNVYGDYSVAARLLDSLAPEKKVTLVRWGDSRDTDADRTTITYGKKLPWGGHSMIPTAYTFGPWTATLYTAVASGAVATPVDTRLSNISGMRLTDIETNGGTPPGSSNLRALLFNSYNSTTDLAMQPQVAGRKLTCKMFFRRAPTGITGDKCVAFAVGDGMNPWYVGEVGDVQFGTYAAMNDTITIEPYCPPDWNWTTRPTVDFEVGFKWTEPTVNGEHLYALSPFVIESDIGITNCNFSMGSASIDTFLSIDVWNPVLWTDYVSHLSGEIVLWLSLGTNGGGLGVVNANTFRTKLIAAIAQFRTYYPGGKVVLDTQYCGSTEAAWLVARRHAMIDVAQTTPGVLCLDTMGEMGDYTTMFAAGLFTTGDTVHLNATGKALMVAAKSDLVYRAAQLA